MRFSVWVSSGHRWEEILSLCRAIEARGWDGIWIPDHFMPPKRGYGHEPAPGHEPELDPVHEAWTLAAAVAGSIPRLTVGVLVSGNTYRHPAVVAKMATTIDHISSGRFVLGLGTGWQENEHHRYGIGYPTADERSDRLEEAAAVIRALTAPGKRATVDGVYYQITDAPLEPKPLQHPLPLLIGGGGEKRTIRTAARYATHWNTWGTPATMRRKIEILTEHCRDAGRDRTEIQVSANAFLVIADDPEQGAAARSAMGERGGLVGTPGEIRRLIEAYSDAGVEELIIAGFNYEPQELPRVLDRFRSTVISR